MFFVSYGIFLSRNTGKLFQRQHRAPQRFPAKFAEKTNTKPNHYPDTKTSSTPMP